jgi:hypothetical protein
METKAVRQRQASSAGHVVAKLRALAGGKLSKLGEQGPEVTVLLLKMGKLQELLGVETRTVLAPEPVQDKSKKQAYNSGNFGWRQQRCLFVAPQRAEAWRVEQRKA